MKCLEVKPGSIMAVISYSAFSCAAFVLGSAEAAWANNQGAPQLQTETSATLDGLTGADGIREWIEVAEPGNLGLLMMGIAGLLIGRWAARAKRKGPPGK